MAKKNYSKLDADWTPSMSNDGSHIAMIFVGENSKGTRVKTTIKMRKGAVPAMIRDIVAIFSADAAAFVRALELVKEAAK